MYNKCLEYLLQNEPEKVISEWGMHFRKILHPIMRFIIPFTTGTKLIVKRRSQVPKNRSVIFAATHSFREDVQDTLLTANKHAYVLIGKQPQLFYSFDGITAWLNGLIVVDRLNKESRTASVNKMIYALKKGSNIVMFPEGTWTKSPNLLINKLFPGIYRVAAESGALVVPIATHREGKYVYSIMDNAFDITAFGQEQGIRILRDKLATIKYELIENHSRFTRKALLTDRPADMYWEDHLTKLTSELKFYDHETEKYTKYVDKNVTDRVSAFDHLTKLKPNRRNAFLFDKRSHH